MNLVYKHERPLFFISLIISIVVWLLLSILVIIYLPLIALFYLFAQSGFISYIKGTGVKLTDDQFPDLYERVQTCAKKLDMDKVPDAYILNADGILNALATKFLGRYYIVLYSDVIDALENHPDSINFYIGHELGHIDQNHLNWALPLWPASLLPILGFAYSRAQEYTCDRYGAACCDRIEDAQFALAVLSSGTSKWRQTNVEAYAAQAQESGRFWMSFHEFTAGYPWLCKRMAWIQAMETESGPKFPRRSAFALLLSLFVPNLGLRGGGGIINLMIVVAIIGILAAVALPAYQDYITTARKAQVEPAFNHSDEIIDAMNTYIIEYNALPQDPETVGLSSHPEVEVIESVEVADSSVIITLAPHNGTQDTIELVPYVDEGQLYWTCSGGSLDDDLRPSECQAESE